MANVLFAVNLLCAGGVIVILWRSERLRPMVVFHVAGLAIAAVLYMMLAYASSASEVAPGRIPIWFYIHVGVAALAYAPFLVFLVVTYVKALGSAAGGGPSTKETRLEDARQAVRLGQVSHAMKIIRGVLEADPENVEGHTIMAEIHLRRGEYQGAVGSYRLAMAGARGDDEFAQFVFTVAVILNEHLGEYQAAARELDLIRRRMPDTPQAEKAQRWIVRIMDQAAREG